MVLEIRGVGNDDIAVPVNNTLVYHMSFLTADTRPCILMCFYPSGFVVTHIYMTLHVKFEHGSVAHEMFVLKNCLISFTFLLLCTVSEK